MPRWQALMSDHGRAVYLDPQTRVYAPLPELESSAGAQEVVLVANGGGAFPADGRMPTPADALSLGGYSTGFMALRAGGNAELSSPIGRPGSMARAGIPDVPLMDVFQHWLDTVPASVGEVRVLTDPGLVVGYWNLPSRPLSADNGTVRAGGRPLKLFDFADFDPRRPHVVSEEQDRVRLSDDPALRRCTSGTRPTCSTRGTSAVSGRAAVHTATRRHAARPPAAPSVPRGARGGELTLSPFTTEGA